MKKMLLDDKIFKIITNVVNNVEFINIIKNISKNLGIISNEEINILKKIMTDNKTENSNN